MCGIVGYIGDRDTADILLESLKRLEYRGYDSAGIAMVGEEGLSLIKAKGRIFNLKDKITSPAIASAGIGHTRWATHGKPSEENAHPHCDCCGRICVVHNGIIENYQSLKDSLIARGHRFLSETDTEVVSHLVEEHYKGDMSRALQEAVKRLRGSFALAVVNKDEPDRIFAVRKESPMVVGLGEGQNFLASDVTAFLKYTNRAVFLEDGDMAVLTKERLVVTDFEGRPVEREIRKIEWCLEAAEKSGYDHFMLKEIHEQPRSLKDAISGRLDELAGEVTLEEISFSKEDIESIKRVIIVACGTSYHAGLLGKYVMENAVDIPVSVEIGSEMRYASSWLGPGTLVIALSQSGETADTIAAVKEATRKNAPVIAITNVMGSTISREARITIYTRSGPEISVAATKSFTAQVVVMYMLSLYLGRARGSISHEEARKLIEGLKALPKDAQQVFEQEDKLKEISNGFASYPSFFFVGRHLNYPVALEGALKLKEISYIFSEGFPAGELKHGPLALITTNVPVVAITPKCPTYDKMVNNIKEIKARDASVIAIASETDEDISKLADIVIRIPDVCEHVAPILSAIVLQLLAYYIARDCGCPIDMPRNLAKSVTVE